MTISCELPVPQMDFVRSTSYYLQLEKSRLLAPQLLGGDSAVAEALPKPRARSLDRRCGVKFRETLLARRLMDHPSRASRQPPAASLCRFHRTPQRRIIYIRAITMA